MPHERGGAEAGSDVVYTGDIIVNDMVRACPDVVFSWTVDLYSSVYSNTVSLARPHCRGAAVQLCQ